MLHTIRNISDDEEGVGVRQVVVDGVAFRDCSHVLDGIDVVVGGCGAETGLHQALGHKHQVRRDNQATRTGRNQQTTLIEEVGNLNDCVFQRSFVKVSRHSRTVCIGATSDQRVSRAEQGSAITGFKGGEAIVEQSRRFDLLGVRHTTSQGLGVTGRELVVQVVFDCFFSNRETHSNGFMVVTSNEGFLRVVIRDGLTFSFNRSGAEAGEFDLFFKGLFRGFGFVDERMLFFVPFILQTKQSVQARQEFFQHLSA